MKHVKVVIYVLEHHWTKSSPAKVRQAFVKHDEIIKNTGLFEMIVGVLTTCHTLEIGLYVFFLFNRK